MAIHLGILPQPLSNHWNLFIAEIPGLAEEFLGVLVALGGHHLLVGGRCHDRSRMGSARCIKNTNNDLGKGTHWSGMSIYRADKGFFIRI